MRLCVIISLGSGTRPMLMSLASLESSQMEEPPAYTTAVQYPVSMCTMVCVHSMCVHVII